MTTSSSDFCCAPGEVGVERIRERCIATIQKETVS